MKTIKRLLNSWLNNMGYYRIKDLQGFGHCGLCGKPINDMVFERGWAIGICEKCEKEYGS